MKTRRAPQHKCRCLFISLGITLCISAVEPQTPGAFATAGQMTTPRSGHQATLLADGRVLITGGSMVESPGPPPAYQCLTSAEIYDPATNAFTPTGSSTKACGGGAATLLTDGRVLIIGGEAELYDPATGAFSRTGPMTTPRYSPAVTLLPDGRVLVAGGTDGTFIDPYTVRFLSSAELYDPATGTFTATGEMHDPWADTATLLPNGKLLITRGAPETIPKFLAEIYDPTTGAFTPTGKMISPHTAPTATLLPNGKVLVAGGDRGDGDGASDIAELYDPDTGTFTAAQNMISGREQNTATLLPDGTVLFTGGHIKSAFTTELYDPAKAAFASSGDMATRRESHTATLLNNGTVLITGGYYQGYWDSAPDAILSSAEVYDPVVSVPPAKLLSVSGGTQGQGAILHAGTHQLVSPGNPAVAGEALEVYCTGLIDGSAIPPQVAIGGRMAETLFFGKAPWYDHLNQVNVRAPSGVAAGDAVAVRMTYMGRPSNQVTIGVK